ITRVNDEEIESPRELARVIANFQPGTEIDVTLWRGGTEEEVKVTLGELPNDNARADLEVPAPAAAGTLETFGLTVARADDGTGLVVTDVDRDSPAAERGIEPGDVIVAVNSNEVNGAEDVEKAVAEA